jgi:hypothetical protein
MKKRKNVKSKSDIPAKSNKYKREKPNTIEIITPVMFLGMLVVEKMEISVFIDESNTECVDELNVTKSTLVNGIETSRRRRVFWSYDKDDWIEIPEDIVEDMYPIETVSSEQKTD